MESPEFKCMDSGNYKKYFRALCWSYTRKVEQKSNQKLAKREKLRRLQQPSNVLPTCYAPAILCNPSHFAVYATVRRLVLARWMHLPGVISDISEESDEEDCSSLLPISKLSKVTGIGLRTVFALISEARYTASEFCYYALNALLDVLQGHAPEELAFEPTEIIKGLHTMLIEVSSNNTQCSDMLNELILLSSSCLVALSVARGEAEYILSAVASLTMTLPTLSEHNLQIPSNLITLQRSVQSVILGPPSRNLWLNYGVPHQCLFTSFPVDLPSQLTAGSSELVVRSLVSDGCYLYVYTSKGLLKIGSGYGSSIKQHVYLHKPDFFASDRHGWLGCCKDKLYVRIGRKKTEIYEIDKETLEIKAMLRLDPGQPVPIEPKSAVFSDGNQLGLIMLTNLDNLTIRMYDVVTPKERSDSNSPITLTSPKYINVHLLRRRTLALGRAPFEDNLSRRAMDLDIPMAMQFDDDEDDPLASICAGQDFGLLSTMSGKVYYTGKATSLGYKSAPPSGRWAPMKETVFIKNDAPNMKKCKVIQVTVGHEGMHAVIVLDNGTALFTGVARRGEDGDTSKHRRTPKATRPKKIYKADGHHVVYAACNYGSTALVTKQGLLLMFGKDSQHSDSNGIVHGLRHERIIQVALGKAHVVALTSFGQVYTFGINNKGQCGREFGYTKEKMYTSRRHSNSTREDARICPGAHTWTTDYCRICVLCRECTGFSSACHCASLPNRVPGERCGCGEGDSGCSVCGVCRRCTDTFAAAGRVERVTDLDDDAETSVRSDSRSEQETGVRFAQYESLPVHPGSASDMDRDAGIKVSSLAPARVAVPGGHRVVAIASGLHHTVLLTEHGEVLTFGSNQYGQLGAGDISAHHRIIRVRVPRASSIAAGSYHTAILSREGELYTFGSYQKGSLGRPRLEELPRNERSPIWYATPGRVPRLGARHACKAVWVSASGDQTFVQVSQALIKTDTLFSATITANSNCIVILPNRPEHTFKCVTINKSDGSCNAWSGSEQVDFVNTLACLDPLYDVLWCYQPQMKLIKCYNILAYDNHKHHRCCYNDSDPDIEYNYPNFGSMKRLDEFKNMQVLETTIVCDDKPSENLALSQMSILNPELAIPSTPGCSVTRMHVSLHLLGCLDSLIYAHNAKQNQMECKTERASSPVVPLKEEFLTVNRFENLGGGWGYSGHSVEAIRFMCDTDILLGGFSLYGGRGDYTAKVKLFDIGFEGGDQEGDGELLFESEELMYECVPRDRYPILFETQIPVVANRWYVAWACINGPSSDCGSSGQAMVIIDEVGFHFKTSKKSNNGTDVNAGQIPCLLYNLMHADQAVPVKHIEPGDPVIALSKNISRKVTVPCFKTLITLLQWSWSTFKEGILETNGQITINFQKLTAMKHQKRLVYIIRACLRLVKSYINEVYPQSNKKRNSHEYMSYFEAIAEIRNLIQLIMSDKTPTCNMLPRRGKNKTHRVCYVQFALELTNSIMNEAHETITACFHAFFPTPSLKWNHLCSLLFHVKDGVVPSSQIRELTSTCAALCGSRSLRDVLQYIVPVTQRTLNEYRKPDSRISKDVPSKSATVPRSSSQKPPPIPPRANSKEMPKPPDPTDSKSSHTDWNLLDVVPKLLDIVTIPVKKQMMTRQCGQPHDHGEIKQADMLSEYCCTLVARTVAELTYSATNIRDLDSNLVKHMVTPSRFMRVNQSRAWHTGNGSPDAVCFTVDRPGVMLVGVCAYGGLGHYEYTLELLQDLRLRPTAEELDPGHCWVSVEVAQGTFCTADCQHDMVQLKFDRPVALKEDLRYAIRLCNHGGRTANGDCGLPSVKGPDGTTFRFASCSLSVNGTSMARGQIPCLIYYGTTKPHPSSESADTLITELRAITLRMGTLVVDRCSDLFCVLRNDLTTEDLKRNASVLQQSPVVNTLVPFTIAHLIELDDSKSIITLLEMVHTLLPHVSAMNLLVPTTEETPNTTGQYYTWIESDHPYKQATVTNSRVLFPPNVSWIVLEMDRRSITAQPEDTLTVYASVGPPRQRCHCDVGRPQDPSFRKVFKRLVQLSSEAEAEEWCDDNVTEPCMHYNCTYFSVTPKLSNNAADWPPPAFIVPGNEVIFSLETASDYLNEFNKTNSEDNRYGYRCLCVGYEDSPFTSQKQGLVALEMELVYAGAGCASRLLSPDLEIPSLNFSTVVEVQLLSMMGANPSGAEVEPSQTPGSAMLLSRGLEISSPPSIYQVLDGHPLIRSVSTERQFLSDFVAANVMTAGGRLARWLCPAPFVEPEKCEIRPPVGPVRPSTKVTLSIIIRDQYGEPVVAPALKVEMLVQRLEETEPRPPVPPDFLRVSIPNLCYQPTIRENMRFHSITMMKAFQHLSFEELRHATGTWITKETTEGFEPPGRVPPERLPVRAQPDGTFHAVWTPRGTGTFLFRCTLDDHPTPKELQVDISADPPSGLEEPSEGRGPPPSPPWRFRRFNVAHSAGLRVRASPSLQAEEVGRVPPGSNIGYIEEVVNKDGTWVRLSEESVRAYTDSCSEVAWCLQHNRHIDRALLTPIETGSSPQSEYTGFWSGYGDDQGDMQSWTQDDELEFVTTEIPQFDRRYPPSSSQSELMNETNSSSNRYAFGGLEPSKRSRALRSESTSVPTPRRVRRSNGNSEETSGFWSPIKHRSSENVRDSNAIQEREPDREREPEREREAERVADRERVAERERVTEREKEAEREQIHDRTETASGTRLAQAGTQTSPDVPPDPTEVNFYLNAKDSRLSPRTAVRERLARRSRVVTKPASSPPPLPARVAPPPPARKLALSPTQAESLRAIFAALLWHEGIVHDAIACSAFLKFHPQLPKQGARVVTRTSTDHTTKHQRHSVEVSNAAGQYLSIQPSTLETLTRSGEEASASRSRKSDIDAPINEEEVGEGTSAAGGAERSVVNVLPPALRALVALWDALYDAKQLSVATDKTRKESTEKSEEEDTRSIIKTRQKKVWRSMPRSPYAVICELCAGSSVPPPLAGHMRHAHPGCRAPTSRGYDRAGTYRRADIVASDSAAGETPLSACGQLAQTCQLWYTFCEKCREKALRVATSIKQPKTKTISEVCLERGPSDVDHHVIRENAVFLLALAPLTSSEPIGQMSPMNEGQARSPPTPAGSMWQPAPPFQCLAALGLEPKPSAPVDTARYHSLGRPPPTTSTNVEPQNIEQTKEQAPRVQRSVSMGQAGGRDLAHAARLDNIPSARIHCDDRHDTLAGAGSSLLSQPSEALRKLVGCGEDPGNTVSAFEAPHVDSDALMKRPVLDFVLARRDLHAYTQKLDGAVRINTVRQYGLEAMNWLLRSTTQPTSVHDVMWWFCCALDKYARTVPPPIGVEDNKEPGANENHRVQVKFPAASSLCPGGNSVRGARTAFHAFLGSVSTLAPSLPPASAAGLQAIRCWALHYSPYDRAFLHRSQIFSVISKVLSHSEEDMYDEGMLGALHESFHSFNNKESYVWSCPDVTSWCDVTVSSRQGMAGALTDGSTETFWESGDEDRDKPRWIDFSYPGGTVEDRPHIICVHIDNTRDTANKTLLASFLYSSGSGELTVMQQIEVDPKSASWLCYTLPRLSSSSIRVRCELRGSDLAVRVRQVRVLGPAGVQRALTASPAHVLHAVAESDALRVFRLLTSQVFGKLLEWERSTTDSNDGVAPADDAAANDSDLREHVVGILFAGHKLTSLQRQVMSHIVFAIGHEAGRVRDDWETALLCADAAERADEPRPHHHAQDNYCFEMLSLLLALSGSAVGCAHLAQRTELLADLLSLLHTGSERVQRQVISLLKRMISPIKPQKALVAINQGNDLGTRVTLLDHLLSYLGKAITVQVKVKGTSGPSTAAVTMGASVTFAPPAIWFMRGETTKKHAHLVARLITDMIENKVSEVWTQETRSALANYVSQVSQVPEPDRRPVRLLAEPTMWLALAALCVCAQEHLDLVNGASEGRDTRRSPEARPFCSNHDDGATAAVIDCRSCGPLCSECDRFLHLNRAAKAHQRQICKEEEGAIRVDIHEGCGRAKLFWLLLLVDRRTLKALAEFRAIDTEEEGGAMGETGFSGTCRFCGARGSTGLLAIGNVCADPMCQEHGRSACNRMLKCGHACGGVRCEPECLPCLHGCGRAGGDTLAPLRQDADDMCMICFTDPLRGAPSIQLSCGHVFHLHCCKKVLANKWNGPRITFSFSQCPICKEDINHWTLEDLLDPIRRLQDEVRRKALMRLEYEGVSLPGAARGRPSPDPALYAMERYAYYVCHKCERAYFGGLARCEAETSGWWEPAELVCGACSDVAGARTCPKHGADFLEYKCRYCCSVAVFFCFGTSHFCNACHDDFQRVTNIPKHSLPQCPAGPKGEQLPGSAEECPLHVQHPSTGEEFALGCGVCRHSQGF